MDRSNRRANYAASAASKQPKSKLWCFTVNNPDGTESIDPSLVDYAIVAMETCPTTGTPHIQGFAYFKAETRLSALAKLLPRAHWTKCNGTALQNSNYCKKGEQPKEEWDLFREKGPNFGLNADYVECGKLPERKSGGSRHEQNNAVALRALDAPTVQEGMAILRREASFDYLRFGEGMERNLKRSKTEQFKSPFELSAYTCNPLVFEKKATLLWGPSGSGKTNFALAHFKNPLFVSHIDALKQLSPDNDAIVFDDMRFTHWPVESVIHLLDYDFPRDINCRYCCAHIPAKMIKVFTHNTENPFYKTGEIEPEQQAAIERRLTRVHVKNNIFI